MKLAIYMLPFQSHVSVLLSVAREMRRRGHEIVVLGLRDLEERVAQEVGMTFVPMCDREYPLGATRAALAPLRSMSGIAGTEFCINMLTHLCAAVLEDGPRALRESQAEALILDFSSRGMDAVAVSMDIPYVHISNAVHSDYSGNTPFWCYDWPPETTEEALARNRAGLVRLAKAAAPMHALLRSFLEEAGVDIAWSDLHALTSKLAWLTQIPPELDFKNSHWPKQLIHVGPLCQPPSMPDTNFPWHRLTGEPLIYVSFGTLQTDLFSLYEVVVKIARTKGYQIVLSTGGFPMDEKLKDIPDNLILVRFAPQVEILRQAALCITHGGVNTVLEALQCGVPLVVLPITNDQPGVAARVAYAGVGAFCRVEDLNPSNLSGLIDEVMQNPGYRARAKQLQSVLSYERSIVRAGEYIEKALASVVADHTEAAREHFAGSE
ncbi:Zeaxanthin glucosyl transferase [Acidisarcina polymorpha]|uniref:Zeaxanthin glucosyl transferase n=1 Tax=Acidisarcina polymorpha TaxID=2211140 RepID=A0A2Z5FWI3_9BACT|nr:nucleotide disphospho-sugar-binding domain-containing protein [Acidisarcina polymorpha]AXC10745.1 Zeaxanthin glucosyl transferase [Acidisarcina polymorpha]